MIVIYYLPIYYTLSFSSTISLLLLFLLLHTIVSTLRLKYLYAYVFFRFFSTTNRVYTNSNSSNSTWTRWSAQPRQATAWCPPAWSPVAWAWPAQAACTTNTNSSSILPTGASKIWPPLPQRRQRPRPHSTTITISNSKRRTSNNSSNSTLYLPCSIRRLPRPLWPPRRRTTCRRLPVAARLPTITRPAARPSSSPKLRNATRIPFTGESHYRYCNLNLKS